MSNQAQRIVDKFGGFPALAKALGRRDISALYRWTKPKEKGGTGGRIPQNHIPALLAAARARGIEVSAEQMLSGDAA